MKYIFTFFISLFLFSGAASKNTNSFDDEKVNYEDWKMLLNMYVTPEGNVNYKGFEKDRIKFDRFLKLLSNTKITSKWTKKDKLAYWINVYNAFTVKLVMTQLPIKSIKDIKNPWKRDFFSIDGVYMSLGHVEHQILRKFNEPRIHFVINCASKSCPRLLQIPYTSENIERLLERQTKEHINKSSCNKITKSTYQLTQLFSWFGKDFKTNGKTIKDFVNKYSSIKIKKQVNKGYLKYNWELNSI